MAKSFAIRGDTKEKAEEPFEDKVRRNKSLSHAYNQQSHIESFSITWKNHLPEKLHATNSDWGKPALVLCFLVSILLEFKKQDEDERVG